ncbi:MAG TPA: M14 family metallopeptidase [Solirubrobacterales bacterium]|nr:M14 family metallopeptidase [Solirubrobacterales bacterium]
MSSRSTTASGLRRALLLLCLLLGIGLAAAAPAAAKEFGTVGAAQGVIERRDGASYRYVTVNPRTKPALTIVERIDMDGGSVDRWWYLRGNYLIPAVAFDGSPGGLSANGNALVLIEFTRAYPPRPTRLAILDTDVYLRHPVRPGQQRPEHAICRLSLPGYFAFQALSPNGSKLYLRRYRPRGRGSDDFGLRLLDARSGRLTRQPLAVSNDQRVLSGLPASGTTSPDGRWTYALYDGDKHQPFLLALDTVTGRLIRVDLPGLERLVDSRLPGRRQRQLSFPYLLKLRLDASGSNLAAYLRSPRSGRVAPHTDPLLSVDVARLTRWRGPVVATASDFLAFTRTPRHPGNLLERVGVVGHSGGGAPIRLRQVGDPSIEGRLLVFGCIHGDECAARGLVPRAGGCPDPRANVFIVPDLNPDGRRLETRVNGRGVDLNRNFPAAWRPIGRRGDPQYAGPRPFSEPETRLAARLVRTIRPQVTVWFHQYRAPRPLVRAWGDSVPAARRLAQLAQLPFKRLPWPDGTAPNWQNHRFPGTSSFVVELPPGRLAPNLETRLATGLDRLAREVGED